MKKQFIFTGTLTYFLITGCTTNDMVTSKIRFSQNKTPLVHTFTQLDKTKIGTGGNPEVHLIHKCFKHDNNKTITCLNELIDKDRSFYVSTDKNWKPIILAGRGTNIEKRTIEIKEDKELILYLDTSNVKLPMILNIKNYQKSEDKHTMIIKINIKEIDEKVTFKDREGNIILDYTIFK